ncbi:MAG TPA: glycosyltransferase family 1 protein, partial [Planctomycetaceae bacterium]|nr:glycosyltransferase family 1 protein [Planctomycetaceae bacterium]
DGIKLLDTQIDGVWRYVRELITALHDCSSADENQWEIDVSLGYLGNHPIEVVVNDYLLESLPESEIHPLFHHGRVNPIVRSQQRIERLKQAGRKGVLAERLRLKYHRLHRSCLKRYGAIKNLIQPSEQQYDLCHLTLPNTWQHYQHVDSPFLTTVHDLSNLICPELQNPSNVRTLADGLQFAGKRDSNYLSVSLATKQQMIELLGIPGERIRVVHNAVTHEKFCPVYDPDRLRAVHERYQLPDDPFFLCLGTIEPRKNLANTIRAFRMMREEHPDLPVHLVLAGGTGWQKLDELRRIIDSDSRIRYIGYVDDPDLAALYSAARALCYASLYEGFGLPLLEAMACGTPVIYGDNSSMPEFAAECGLPVVSEDPHSIKQAFHRLSTDRALHNQLASNAYARGQSLTWQKTARHTLSLYRNLIENHRANSRYSRRKKVA